jgi:quercetin dioxygenase-like cupin family protein
VDPPFDQGISIPAGADRYQHPRKMFGTMSIDYKVSALDTNSDLLILENTNDHKGGPPRHLHHEQEEWFYVVNGEYTVEIGEERHRLEPGESILAPRRVPHVWAHVGEGTGKALIAFRPAGKMEAFFGEMAKVKGIPPREELQRLFGLHGMEITGPPLSIE